jgi:hypothetical protein
VRYFPAAPMDGSVKLVSFGSVLLLLLFMPIFAAGSEPVAVAAVFGIGAAIVLVVWGFAPGGYSIGPDGRLRIHRRLFGTLDLTRRGPAAPAPWTLGFGSIRVGGSGGLFGFFGRFYKPGVGSYRAYLTRRSQIVSVPTDRGLVVLSPADMEAFVDAATQGRP